MKKFLVTFIISTVLFGIGYYIYLANQKRISISPAAVTKAISDFSPLSKKDPKDDSTLPRTEPINILLLGIDRRRRTETSFRSDSMILFSLNPTTNRIVLTSVPRDLWVGGGVGRINALFVSKGWEGIRDEFQLITGLKIQKYIMTDFADFKWLVDAMGGVKVDVQTTFTDTQFPVDATLGYQTVSFTKGPMTLAGESALNYARSRHGNNGEGSDFMRMRRQHQILKGMVDSVLSPKSIFNPMVIEKAFATLTTGKLETNLELADAYYLWDFYKDKDKYTYASMVFDSTYIYNPPMSDYGGAWVLIPKTTGIADFHKAMNDALSKPPVTPQSN